MRGDVTCGRGKMVFGSCCGDDIACCGVALLDGRARRAAHLTLCFADLLPACGMRRNARARAFLLPTLRATAWRWRLRRAPPGAHVLRCAFAAAGDIPRCAAARITHRRRTLRSVVLVGGSFHAGKGKHSSRLYGGRVLCKRCCRQRHCRAYASPRTPRYAASAYAHAVVVHLCIFLSRTRSAILLLRAPSSPRAPVVVSSGYGCGVFRFGVGIFPFSHSLALVGHACTRHTLLTDAFVRHGRVCPPPPLRKCPSARISSLGRRPPDILFSLSLSPSLQHYNVHVHALMNIWFGSFWLVLAFIYSLWACVVCHLQLSSLLCILLRGSSWHGVWHGYAMYSLAT